MPPPIEPNPVGSELPPVPPGAAPRLRFGRRLRLTHNLEFEAVYEAKMKKASGSLVGFSRPNGLSHYRLGLAVGKRVGSAVERNRVKRRIREAFRTLQAGLPRSDDGAYDLVVSAYRDDPAGLKGYQQRLTELAAALHLEWQRRARRKS